MRVRLDRELCDGNGICAVEAPAFFELDDDDELIVLREDFGPDEATTVALAVRGCPKHALVIED